MSNALIGPVGELGTELRLGSEVYFEQLNRRGGIYDRKVTLISLNDSYEPKLTVINTRKLIEDEKVFALFGYVGTPTSHAILSILQQSRIPYITPFTGADFLRQPVKSNIFNLRASYHQEAEQQIDYIVNKMRYKNIALVIQADEYGLAAQRAITKKLSRYNIEPIINARYQRNTQDMSSVLNKLKTKPIDAVIFIGTYEPLSHLINLAAQEKIDVLFTSLSFVASHALFSRLKYQSRVMVTEVVPDPYTCQWSLCQQFRLDMKEHGIEEMNRVQFEGYLNAYVFSEVAKRCKNALTQQCLIEKFERFTFNDNGLSINFTKKNHQGFRDVFYSFSPGYQPQR